MLIKRWNYETHEYDDVYVNGPCLRTYSDDPDAPTKCPNCGKIIKFGESFTSYEYRTETGIGYAVCEKCHQEELDRKIKHEIYDVLK